MFNLGDKSALKSLTMIGAALFAALQALEGLGQIPEGVAAQAAAVAKGAAFILTAFGARRAIGENGLIAPFKDEVEVAAATFEDEEPPEA